MSHIFHKNLETGLPFAKTLIEYNNSLEKTEDEEKEPTDIEFTEQKADPEIMKMLLTLDGRVYKKTRKTLLWLTSFKITKTS